MSRKRLCPIAVIAALVVLMLVAVLAKQVQAAGMTARAGLAQANAAAQKWQKDAVLVLLSTLEADGNGTAAEWSYLYYSAKAKNGYSVDIKGGKVVERLLDVGPYLKDAVGDFVDSDKAMAEAKKNGLKSEGKPPMTLMVMGQAIANPGTFWSVGSPLMPGDVSVMLEAKSGKFRSKHSLP